MLLASFLSVVDSFMRQSMMKVQLSRRVKMTFDQMLKESGLTKAELARQLGLTAGGVSLWKGSPPKYAVAYIELLIQYQSVSSLLRRGLSWMGESK